MQSRGNILIGLHTDFDTTSDSGNLFSSDEEGGGVVLQVPVVPLAPIKIETSTGIIKSFDDMSPHLSTIFANLKNYQIPPAVQTDIYFIPENIVPDELSRALTDFGKNPTNKEIFDFILSFDSSDFPDAIIAQIELLNFYQTKESSKLKKLSEKKLDSRILSLIHFVLIENPDRKVSLFHTVTSLEEYIKFPTPAPITVLFPEFTVEKLILRLCTDLVDEFPRHSFLEYVLADFVPFNPEINNLINLLKNQISSSNSSDDDDMNDDSNDSLSEDSVIEKIRQSRTLPPPLLLPNLGSDSINPLDSQSHPASRYEPVILREPPPTATFLLDDGTDQMSHNMFENWIFSIRCDRPETIKNANQFTMVNPPPNMLANGMPHSYKSNPILSPNLGQSDEGSTRDENVEFFFNLLHHVDDQAIIKQQLPTSIAPGFYSLYLPVLHTLNIVSENVEMRGAIYSKLLLKEKEAHFGLRLDDPVRAERTLTYLKTLVPSFEFDQIQPNRLERKRPQPPLTPENPDTFVALMAVIDYELVIHSRSPLSLQYYTVNVEDRLNDSPAFDPRWRAAFLFWQYTTNSFSPYMCFRIAFSLAVNLAEKKPDIACSFIFEALYTLLHNIPYARKLPCVRSSYLFFGEILERLNRYYYAAHVLDNFFLTDIRNASYSSKIAQIAAKNNDAARALFHYNQTLKNFVAHGSVDEALYVGQVISSLYIEHGYSSLAMSLLTYLLHISYGIAVGKKREKMEVVALGSLRIPRSRVPKLATFSEFRPDTNNASTILSAAQLAILFCKLNYFTHASKLLGAAMKDSGASMKKLLQYIQAYAAFHENNFTQMLEVAPKIDLLKGNPQQRPSLNSHFTLMSASNFDPNAATLRLFTRAYIDRNQFRQAFIYSELFIYASSPLNMKEIGTGFFLRGISLLTAYRFCQSAITLYASDTDLGNIQCTFDAERLYTKQDLSQLALSSLCAARSCFSRVSSSNKLAMASLAIIDIVMSLGMDEIVPAQQIELLSKVPNRSPDFNIPIEKISVEDLLVSTEHLTNRILEPFYVIHFELLKAQHNLIKDKVLPAKTQFDFAFTNFQKLFTCGYRFIPVDLNIKRLRYVCSLLEKMCSVLVEFDSEFINDRLLAFDIYNDACCIMKNRLRNTEKCNLSSIDPSIDLSPIVLDMENPKFPSFASILKSNGFITESTQPFADESTQIIDYLNFISANVKLFNKEKLPLDELQIRNRRYGEMISSYAETIRRQNASQLPPETSFSFLQRCKPRVSGAVFVQRLLNTIVIYVPSTGYLRKVTLPSSDQHTTIVDGKNEYPYDIKSTIFDQKFIEFCASFILCDKKSKKPSPSSKLLLNAAKALFGNVLLEKLLKQKVKVVDDSSSFGASRLFGKNSSSKKGSLFTLDAGETPLIFIASHDIQFIPYELLFPDCLTIRCPFFMQLMLRSSNNCAHMNITRPIVCRYRNEVHAQQRTKELLDELFVSIGGGEIGIGFVDGLERSTNFPTPLLSSGTKEFDIKKYSFFDFIDVEPNEFPKTQNASSALFVFSYSDLCEMPVLVRRIMAEYPFSFFMFIPVLVMKEAFREMRHIFERQAKRNVFIKSAKNAPGTENNRIVCENAMKFVLDLQITLQKSLKASIPLISYLH